jgi:hypothetical protein
MTGAFLISVLIIIFLFNFVFLRNKSLKVKILVSIALVLGAFGLLIAIAAFLFYNSTDPRERAAEEAARSKWLSIKNLTPYSHLAIISYRFKDGKGLKKISDTLNVTTGAYHSSEYMLPISTGDSIYFPEDFKLQIKDSLNNTIVAYNKAQFLQKAVTDDSTYRPKNKMALNFYVIEIN